MAEPISISQDERFAVVASENSMLRIEVQKRMDREDVMLRRIRELEEQVALTPPNRAGRKRGSQPS